MSCFVPHVLWSRWVFELRLLFPSTQTDWPTEEWEWNLPGGDQAAPRINSKAWKKGAKFMYQGNLVWTPWWPPPLSLSLLLHCLWDDSQLCLYLCIILRGQRPGRSISHPRWQGLAAVYGFLSFLSGRQDPPSLAGSHSRGFPKIGRRFLCFAAKKEKKI